MGSAASTVGRTRGATAKCPKESRCEETVTWKHVRFPSLHPTCLWVFLMETHYNWQPNSMKNPIKLEKNKKKKHEKSKPTPCLAHRLRRASMVCSNCTTCPGESWRRRRFLCRVLAVCLVLVWFWFGFVCLFWFVSAKWEHPGGWLFCWILIVRMFVLKKWRILNIHMVSCLISCVVSLVWSFIVFLMLASFGMFAVFSQGCLSQVLNFWHSWHFLASLRVSIFNDRADKAIVVCPRHSQSKDCCWRASRFRWRLPCQLPFLGPARKIRRRPGSSESSTTTRTLWTWEECHTGLEFCYLIKKTSRTFRWSHRKKCRELRLGHSPCS